MARKKKNKPVEKYQKGLVKIAKFENIATNSNGKQFVGTAYQLQRSYVKDDEFHNLSMIITARDLPRVADVINQALENA